MASQDLVTITKKVAQGTVLTLADECTIYSASVTAPAGNVASMVIDDGVQTITLAAVASTSHSRTFGGGVHLKAGATVTITGTNGVGDVEL